MAITPATIGSYAPWGNAQLAFEVATGLTTTDPTTGNTTQSTEIVEYLAAITLQPPRWAGKGGIDTTTYACEGRLLSPSVLDPRITNGSQAVALINGYQGRFELTYSLNMDRAAYRDIRQTLSGIFRVVGGPA
jgi:hypothetical protein